MVVVVSEWIAAGAIKGRMDVLEAYAYGWLGFEVEDVLGGIVLNRSVDDCDW